VTSETSRPASITSVAAVLGSSGSPSQTTRIDRRAELLLGSDADLVVWDGDPLEPSTAATLVMLAGREVSLVTRQTLLRDRYAPKAK